MPSQRWQRVDDLFTAARALPPQDRAAYLSDACGSDVELRAEVESLLTHADSRDGFLSTPAAAIASPGAGPSVSPSAFAGQTLGVYRVVSLLGIGGMGEVYLARDTKLTRDVAIKMLPTAFMQDPTRRARFEREARVLAAFTHPNIATIHGLEEFDGRQALVLEYVGGETLEARIGRGPLPLTEALDLARQIASALDTAHEAGIVHRDLKPANVKVSPKGVVKVLDFGLAKAAVGEAPGADLAAAPTMTASATRAGMVLGTPRYMSPEQARGQGVDKRTDIWAFGCVVYEMLTGRPAFAGATVADTIAAVVDREPDWSAFPASVPDGVRKIVRRCLEKDVARRSRDIGDLQFDLGEFGATSVVTPSPEIPAQPPRLTRTWGIAATLLLALLAGVAWVSLRPTTPPAATVASSIEAPPGMEVRALGGLALSPDGRRIAFQAGDRLWVRALSEATATEVASQGTYAFWSPDGRALGFIAGSALKLSRLDSGVPIELASGTWRGGTFAGSDSVLFGQDAGPIQLVSTNGGPVSAVTTLSRGDRSHRWPWMLPDGDHFLFLAVLDGSNELRVGSLSSPTTTSLGPSQANAIFAAGHLLFLQGGNLVAQPFDVKTLTKLGPTPVLLAGATTLNAWGLGAFSSSDNGLLAHVAGPAAISQRLTWISREGVAGEVVGEAGRFFNLSLSADEGRLAVSRLTGAPANIDVWVYDLRRGGATRVTSDQGMEFDPAWSPDGTLVAFNSNRTGRFQLMQRAANGEGHDELLVATDSGASAPRLSPNNDSLVFARNMGPLGGDLFVMALPKGGDPEVFLSTGASENSPSFSPDGKRVVYASNASGRSEIYIRPFPRGVGVVQVSRDGGANPEWRADGKEIFFLDPARRMMTAEILIQDGAIRASTPKVLFETGLEAGNGHPYAVSKDGSRFIMPVAERTTRVPSISLLTNWPTKIGK